MTTTHQYFPCDVFSSRGKKYIIISTDVGGIYIYVDQRTRELHSNPPSHTHIKKTSANSVSQLTRTRDPLGTRCRACVCVIKTLTLGGGQHDLLLRVDVLQLLGAEALQLALQVDGDLRQVLQGRGAHG